MIVRDTRGEGAVPHDKVRDPRSCADDPTACAEVKMP